MDIFRSFHSLLDSCIGRCFYKKDFEVMHYEMHNKMMEH